MPLITITDSFGTSGNEIGTANITGVAVSQEEKNRIPEIVKNVNGISHVNANLSVWVYPL